MTEQRGGREALIAAIAEQSRLIGWRSERIGHVFAHGQHLHTTDFRALHVIYQAALTGRPLTSKALAAELQLTPAAVTYVVERLVTSGHVRRDQDPADRRRVLLRVDEPGLALAGAFFGPLGAAHHAALADFTDAELETGVRLLGSLLGVLESFEARARDLDAGASGSAPDQID